MIFLCPTWDLGIFLKRNVVWNPQWRELILLVNNISRLVVWSLKKPVLNYRVNVSVGPQEDRMMTTGKHTVADIYCNCCQQIVGWKYVSLLSKSQNIVLQTLEGPKASICQGTSLGIKIGVQEARVDNTSTWMVYLLCCLYRLKWSHYIAVRTIVGIVRLFPTSHVLWRPKSFCSPCTNLRSFLSIFSVHIFQSRYKWEWEELALSSLLIWKGLTFMSAYVWHGQESAYEKTQKYKEGKFILERYALQWTSFDSPSCIGRNFCVGCPYIWHLCLIFLMMRIRTALKLVRVQLDNQAAFLIGCTVSTIGANFRTCRSMCTSFSSRLLMCWLSGQY